MKRLKHSTPEREQKTYMPMGVQIREQWLNRKKAEILQNSNSKTSDDTPCQTRIPDKENSPTIKKGQAEDVRIKLDSQESPQKCMVKTKNKMAAGKSKDQKSAICDSKTPGSSSCPLISILKNSDKSPGRCRSTSQKITRKNRSVDFSPWSVGQVKGKKNKQQLHDIGHFDSIENVHGIESRSPTKARKSKIGSQTTSRDYSRKVDGNTSRSLSVSRDKTGSLVGRARRRPSRNKRGKRSKFPSESQIDQNLKTRLISDAKPRVAIEASIDKLLKGKKRITLFQKRGQSEEISMISPRDNKNTSPNKRRTRAPSHRLKKDSSKIIETNQCLCPSKSASSMSKPKPEFRIVRRLRRRRSKCTDEGTQTDFSDDEEDLKMNLRQLLSQVELTRIKEPASRVFTIHPNKCPSDMGPAQFPVGPIFLQSRNSLSFIKTPDVDLNSPVYRSPSLQENLNKEASLLEQLKMKLSAVKSKGKVGSSLIGFKNHQVYPDVTSIFNHTALPKADELLGIDRNETPPHIRKMFKRLAVMQSNGKLKPNEVKGKKQSKKTWFKPRQICVKSQKGKSAAAATSDKQKVINRQGGPRRRVNKRKKQCKSV